ncbi:MAG: glycoside hydrolase, partial [Actinomycetota bacterium]|nr:glycoside hydrolase [Actinomycetota bacterium]
TFEHAFNHATFAEQDVSVKRLTAAAQMTKDNEDPTRAFTGPTSMLAHPTNPWVIVAATANLRTRVCYLVRSTDAGRTWHILDALPSPRDYPYCTTTSAAGVTEAPIAWGRDGTLYYALLGYGPGEGPREGNISVVLARSTDLGDTWKTTIVDNNRGKSGLAPSASSGVPGLAVDTSGPRDVVYVGFSHRFLNPPKDSPLNNMPVLVSVSTDGGATFAPPVNLNDFSQVTHEIAGKSYPLLFNSSFGRPFLAAHDGVVLAVSDSRTPFDDEPPGESYYAMPQVVARSTDQGRTWSVATLGPPVFTGTGAQTGMGWTPKGGPKGTFIVAYAATPETADSSGTADIVVQRSTDDGKTWSEPLAIDDDNPADLFTSFYPQLGVAPNGRVDVVWQDNRHQTDYHFQVRYTYSTDGGVTWAPNVLVSDQPINFNLGVSFNSDLRQPPGVASANQYAAFGWADTRLGDELTQTQDNFSTVAQFSPLPAGTSLLPLVAAVFGGLVAAGIILLVVLLIRRRRRGPRPSRVERPEPVGAR